MEQVHAKGIQFGLLSSDVLRKISVLKVESNDLYDKGIPKAGGLCDLRLGTTDRQFKCQTCNGDILVCPGHFGHIDLVIPMYHIGFMKMVMKVLQTVCFECSKCLIDIPCTLRQGDKRFKTMHDKCKTKYECVHCSAIQPKYSFDAYKIYMELNDEKKLCTARNALFIIKRISDNDVKYIGFNPEHGHPKNLILTTVPVSPPQVRPSILMDTSLRSQDDLTHKLSEIIRSNINLGKHIETNTNENTITEFTNLLQFHVNTLIDNEIPGQPQATQRTGRPMKAISQRLKAKGGRIRGNLMGKRVNFSARSVITAEPNIDLDELGVPIAIAANMTVPETVTEFNKHIMESYVRQGPIIKTTQQVGAKYVIREDGTRCDMRFKSDDFILKIGDVVERTMKDGDLVVFNRQPTLHKMSMMAHSVRVMEHKTFRMNLSATTPYNADFDGDEMNLHLPQSMAAKAELKELMMVTNNIVSAQANKPVIGIVQDSLLASWKMTGRDIFFTREDMTNIVINSKERIQNVKIPPPTILKPIRMWTGKQIFAMLIPRDFYFYRKSSWNSPDDKVSFTIDDSEVIIQNGCIVSGQLCKKSLGSSEGGIIHRLWLEYSPEIAKNFISSLQYMVNYFIQNSGFSIGAGDVFIDKETKKKVKVSIEESITQVRQILHVSQQTSNKELFEKKINHILNNAMAQSGRFVQDKITIKNNIHATVTAGSKGSVLNLSQIMACVGQQNVNGQRIIEGYNDRPLPHFPKHDQSPEARGFVKHSYLEGLEAHEFFFHSMGGREGVIDTAVKSVTGDTELVLIENGNALNVSIGEWIDKQLLNHKDKIKYHDETEANMELLDIDKAGIVAYIPTTTNDGKMSWGKITNVTRHDPSDIIYKITTDGGRSVKVVASKSLLVWNEDEDVFVPTDTTEVHVGDYVPVSFNFQNNHSTTHKIDCLVLDGETGFFIGVYLASGHSDFKTGKVAITHMDGEHIQRVQRWFEHNGIKHETMHTTVVGDSAMLANCLIEMFVKDEIPAEFHVAPDDFIKGFVEGYYIFNGFNSENTIGISGCSQTLVNGISMLLSRFGIYSEIFNKVIKIRSTFVQRFVEVIGVTLHDVYDNSEATNIFNAIRTKNDTVLDRIASIEVFESSEYPKVYDFTVPSTLNFGLANGLQVYDTSETGYIQRRLVKAMEDLMVEFDGSIRNSSSDIVQFMYGDDGYDGALLMTQRVYKDNNSEHASAEEINELSNIHSSMSSVKSPLLIDVMCEKYKRNCPTTLKHADVYNDVKNMLTEMKVFSGIIRNQVLTAMSSKRIIDEYNITPEDFAHMKENVVYQHNRAKVCKGDMTGIIAAQSMGEVVTQLCLNTFHSAGISAKNVTLGVPRFKELINVAKNIKSPIMTLPLRDEYNNLDNIDFIAQTLEYVNIQSLISRKYMSYKRLEMTEHYLSLGNVPEYFGTSIVFHFNMDALKRSGKTLFDIYMCIIKNYEDTLIPVYNHENDDPIMEILVLNEEDINERYIFILMNKIMSKLTIDGTEEIKRTYVRKDDTNGKWFIETDGLNIEHIFSSPYFDHANCTSNHVMYTYEHFGIEAARNTLLKEIKHVIEFDGGYVNRRHFYILADTMTHKGDIMPITRHGINKANTGPLMKCSFEETIDILTDAGIFSEFDHLNGVTENIIMGRLAPIGTGSSSIIFKTPKLDMKDLDFDIIEPEVDDEFVPASESGSEHTETYYDIESNVCTETYYDEDASTTCTETYFPM